MKRKIVLFPLVMIVSMLMVIPTFAGTWQQNETGWWYENDDGSFPANQGQWIGDKYYYFNEEGYLAYNMITSDELWIGNDGYWIMDNNINPEVMSEKGLNGTLIVFDKYSHQLELWINGEKKYNCIGICGSVSGDKEYEGDCRTPEGEFYVCIKNANSKCYKSFGLSYPNIEDAKRGMEQGLITEEQHKNIVMAIERGAEPNWYTPLGGEVMIHGMRTNTGGTRGCIAIRNEDMAFLWDIVNTGTKVIVLGEDI